MDDDDIQMISHEDCKKMGLRLPKKWTGKALLTIDKCLPPNARPVRHCGIIPLNSYIYVVKIWSPNEGRYRNCLNLYFRPVVTKAPWLVNRWNTYQFDKTKDWLFVHMAGNPEFYGFLVKRSAVQWV